VPQWRAFIIAGDLGYFAIAHFAGAIYSLKVVHDANLAGVFFGNCIACAALVAAVC
jgi:hypothetical protein